MAESSGESGEENPFGRAYEDWRARTPLLSRVMAVGILVCYVASWLVDISWAVACIPYKTAFKGQVYRLVLSPLGGNSLLGALFAAFALGDSVGPRLERSLGTLSFGALTLVAVVGINLCFVALCLVAAASSPEVALYVSAGAWSPLLTLITVESLSAPEATRRLLFLPIEIPRLYYPLALAGLFMLLEGPRLDLALGVGLGYAERYGYLSAFRPPTALLSRIETQRCLAHLVADPAYVTARAALGAAAWVQLTQDADWAERRSSSGLATVLDAFRRRTAADEPVRQRFPDSGGHVLGNAASPAAPVVAVPVPPTRTAAANRDKILAAAEKRAAGSSDHV
mmetsp:Transcript_18167/g.57058  ORF Transcript_18167/g.57058 Transcript_18167/m.57058 type:complete len:340 (+) Transcript_18167:1039-2058(+)